MKFLVIQENGRHEKNRTFRECFSVQRALKKHKHECTIWGLGHSNYKSVIDFNAYDVIIDLENYDDTGWLPDLSLSKAYKIVWDIDSHVRGINYYWNRFNKNKCHLMLCSTLDSVKKSKSIWFPNCFDDTLIVPRMIMKRSDVGFCGNILNRQEYISVLKTNFNFISDIFVIGDDMVNAINSYKIHFNRNISNDINYRNFETIGCKIPLITNYNRQYDDLEFKEGFNCFFYKDIRELLDKTGMLVRNECLRNRLANMGHELSKKHTYFSRMRTLIDYLKGKV